MSNMMIHKLYSLMVIYNFNVIYTGILPREYDSPLSIDSNTMIAFVITPQCFKPGDHEKW